MQNLHDGLVSRLNSPQAGRWLMYAAAVETVGAPVRADLLLADKVLLSPTEVWRHTAAAVLGSVVAGGVLYTVGAVLGLLGGLTLLQQFLGGAWLLDLQVGMQGYAPLLVVAAGMATIPFGVLLLLAGLLGAAPLWLLPAALAARGVRYGLMAWLLWRGGTRYRDWLARYYHGLTMVVALGLLLLAVFGLLLKYL
ncbi:MAG: hypothetical protein INF43_03005 [Alphaproteobacteria bacterium]|nr:hypothetical protein [Alphaproteobacteria bacterium]